MLSRIANLLTGRSYSLEWSDLQYAYDKAALDYVRGLFWSIFSLRRPCRLMLGTSIKFVSPGQLSLESGVSIGRMSYIDCSAEFGIHLGAGVTIREFAWVQCRSGFNKAGHSLRIGESAYIGPFAVIGVGGPVSIGAHTQIGARLTITAESHAKGLSGSYVEGVVSRKGVSIGGNCWIGANVSILDGVEIGDDCVIGAGSTVTRSIPSQSKAYGVPCRVVGKL